MSRPPRPPIPVCPDRTGGNGAVSALPTPSPLGRVGVRESERSPPIARLGAILRLPQPV
jgi:hypothetical protein